MIVKMHDAFFNSLSETTYLVMDFVEGKTLAEFLKAERLSEEDVKYAFKQVL